MNKFFAILIMCSLSFPALAIDEQEMGLTTSNEENFEKIVPEATETQDTPVVREELQPVPVALPSRYKEPVSKKKLAKKFIIAMLCVAGTSVFLYGTLSIYNKVRTGFIAQAPIPPEGEKPLDAPDDLTDAVKTFIEKTKWQG